MSSDSPEPPFQIFVSYARDDDVAPPLETEVKGFVSTLLKHLEYHFTSLGPPRPTLWRDTRVIDPSAQFDPLIAKGIEESQVLLVVLSNNWINRPYCRAELEMFGNHFALEGSETAKQRIIVVQKHYLDPQERPALLQGQSGYAFYRNDGEYPENFVEYFGHAKLPEEFHDLARALATDLWKRPQVQARGRPTDTPANLTPPVARKASRSIYVARPAPDMQGPYSRLVDELRFRQYRVIPEQEIPFDGTASGFIVNALAEAESSIHLLGAKAGFTPEDASSPIAKLQLELAAVRAAEGGDFHRIIWAPKVFVFGSQSETQRDPLAVLQLLDAERPDDKIDGREISAFVEFVLQHLERSEPPPSSTAWEQLSPDARVYLYHSNEDLAYALEVGAALQKLNVEAVTPALEGDPAEVAALHHQDLAECDAVVLCWANAPDVWVKSRSHELRSWRALGREKNFVYRSLIAGPPPSRVKEGLLNLPPRCEIDVVVDLTGVELVSPENLHSLVRNTPETTM